MLREATVADLAALGDLEREANLAGLAHVFAPERYPFPDDDVLARWALVLDEPGARTMVHDAGDGSGLDGLAAYDDRTLRHLAVRPDRWGQGLGSALVGTALAAMAARGTEVAQLWCLEDNHRARRLYELLGWGATPDRQPAAWPPYPTELRYTRPVARPTVVPARRP